MFKEEFRCVELLCLCSEIYCFYESPSKKISFSSKGQHRRTLNTVETDPWQNIEEFWTKQKLKVLRYVDFAQKHISWQPTSRQRNDSLIFILNEHLIQRNPCSYIASFDSIQMAFLFKVMFSNTILSTTSINFITRHLSWNCQLPW